MKIRTYTLSRVFFIVFIVSLSGCVNSSYQETTPTPSITGTIIETTEPVTTSDGLTYEENLAINPPPPINLTGKRMSDSIILRWDRPETVTIPHNYSDIIIQYRIYRGTSEQDMSYLTSTANMTFKDTGISYNQKYIYEITAVHEGNTESVPSKEIFLTPNSAK